MIPVLSAATYSFTNTTQPSVTLNSSTIQPIASGSDACNQTPDLRNTLFLSLSCIVVIVGVIGNGLTILVISYSRYLRGQTTYCLILSLAAADFLYSVLFTPFKVHRYARNDNFCLTLSLCRAYILLEIVLGLCSISHLFVITIDRFLAVSFPFWYIKHITRNVGYTAIIMVWIYSIFWASLSKAKWDTEAELTYILDLEDEENYRLCIVDNKFFFGISTIVCHIIPVGISICLYLRIIVIAQRHSRAIRAAAPGQDATVDMKSIRIVVCIFTAYAVCWLPVLITIILETWSQHTVDKWRTSPNFDIIDSLIVNVLPPINSCINPFIYFLLSARFRSTIVDIRKRIVVGPVIIFGVQLRNMHFNRETGHTNQSESR